MTGRTLTVGVYRYEHTEPLFDGRVAIEGVDATVGTFLRYHYEQGLSRRLLTSADIFVPGLLGT